MIRELNEELKNEELKNGKIFLRRDKACVETRHALSLH